MQNVFNLISPFFDPVSGNPLVGGRVTFVEPQNDNQTVLTHVFDKDHNEIQNPLPLNDMGVFEIQPFVEDGIEYKMLVERATGLDDPQWELVYTMDSKTQKLSVEYSGAAVAASIDELRSVDPEVGVCVVLGYSSADDFCPSRTFRWVQEPYSENYGTRIKSAVEGYANQGTWVYEPSGFVDVRTFGINNDQNPAVDLFQGLSRIKDSHPNLPVYFPPSEYNYLLSSSIDLKAVIMDRNAKISPHPDVGNSVQLGIGWLENRGGKFCATQQDSPTAPRVIPKLNGLLKTSWLQGTLAEFLTEGALQDLDTIDFGRAETEESKGSADVGIEGKILLNVQNKPTNISWENCLALDNEQTATLEKLNARSEVMVGGFEIKRVSNSLQIVRDYGNGTVVEFLKFILQAGTQPNAVSFPIRTVFNASPIFNASAQFLSAIYVGEDGDNAWIPSLLKAKKIYCPEITGTVKGALVPDASFFVDMVGGDGSGMSGTQTVNIKDGEIFFISIHAVITQTTGTEAFVSRTLTVNGASNNLRIVVSTTDRASDSGDVLIIGRRKANGFFFDKESFLLGSGLRVNILVHGG